jgi:hypothetical protein
MRLNEKNLFGLGTGQHHQNDCIRIMGGVRRRRDSFPTYGFKLVARAPAHIETPRSESSLCKIASHRHANRSQSDETNCLHLTHFLTDPSS